MDNTSQNKNTTPPNKQIYRQDACTAAAPKSHVNRMYYFLQPEFWKCWDVFLNLNKMKTKRLSNHMSQYFIHNRT